MARIYFHGTAVPCILLLLTATSIGAPITSISGSAGAGPGISTTPLLSFTGGPIQASTAPPASQVTYPPTPGSYSLGAFTIDVTNFSSNPGTVNLTTPTLTITDTNTLQTAVFTVVGSGAPGVLSHVSVPPSPPVPGFEFGGAIFLLQLTSNGIAGLDLGPLNDYWDFIVSYNGLSIVPGPSGSYTVVGGSSSASFNLNSNIPLNSAAVPEPASMLAWGTVIGLGWVVSRRHKIKSLRGTKPDVA